MKLHTITEVSRNHMGENEIHSFSKWKAACRRVNASVWFDGDSDISQALIGPKPYVRGETKSIGEWDGETGSVYGNAHIQKESVVMELSNATMSSYRKKAIADAMKKHHESGPSEIEACKRAKNIARSVRLQLRRKNQLREAVLNMPIDAAKARLADLQDFLSNVPSVLSSQEQYDEVDNARDEVAELKSYIEKNSVNESAETAETAYASRVQQCKDFLHKIEQYLDVHAAKQQQNPSSWGFAGDLAEVVTQLEEIWEFLSSGGDVNESAEPIHEVSKTTLQSYVVKRAKKHGDRQYDRANGDAFSMGSEVSQESRGKWVANEKRAERQALRNIQRAAARLADPSYGSGRREENEEQGEFSPQFVQGVARGEIDLYDAMNQNTPDSRALQRLYDVVAAENHLSPDDDHEAILDTISDQLSQKFGDL